MTGTTSNARAALGESSYDWLVLGTPENVYYTTGYRSVAADLFAAHRMLALVSVERTIVVAGASDGAAALESGLAADDYVPFGTFFFESVDGSAPESKMSDRWPTFEEAVAHALTLASFEGRVGLDVAGAAVAPLLTGQHVDVSDATEWIYELRARKLPSEIDRLRRAAMLAEAGIDRAIEVAGVGVSEAELADVVTSTMAAGGGFPRFAVVTSGPRSALSDARPTQRALEPGDLLRFDVGCTVDGYWSDIGRTAVVGPPSGLQTSRYDAILAGEQSQLDMLGPGVIAEALFEVAVDTVEGHGLEPYRRQHCGHAIGLEVYERPVVAPGWSTALKPGMVFCLETPYYEIGWGGMMIEDAVVVTDDGYEMLTTSDRSLRIIEA